jgi:hypothetical protein
MVSLELAFSFEHGDNELSELIEEQIDALMDYMADTSVDLMTATRSAISMLDDKVIENTPKADIILIAAVEIQRQIIAGMIEGVSSQVNPRLN